MCVFHEPTLKSKSCCPSRAWGAAVAAVVMAVVGVTVCGNTATTVTRDPAEHSRQLNVARRSECIVDSRFVIRVFHAMSPLRPPAIALSTTGAVLLGCRDV